MSDSMTIRGARLVLPDRVVTGDVAIEDGVIHDVGPSLDGGAGEEIDATGLVVLPGLIDPLALLPLESPDGADDVASGSAAAALGGYTSLLLADLRAPAVDSDGLCEQIDAAARDCRVNFGVYQVVADGCEPFEHPAGRSPGMLLRFGAEHGPAVRNADHLDELFSGEGRLLVADGWPLVDADPADHGGSLGRESALRLLAALARKHGRRLHVANVATFEELDALGDGDDGRLSAHTSAAQLFLAGEQLSQSEDIVADPPLGGLASIDALWAALDEGRLHAVSSSHLGVRQGDGLPAAVCGFEWVLPLWMDAVAQGRIGLRDVARWTSEGPARIFGVPRKGRIEVGFDADLVLVDPQEVRVVEPPYRTRTGWCPFEGMELRGWPKMTILGGRAVFRDGRLVDGVRGRELSFSRAS